jgi:hypothetical protein
LTTALFSSSVIDVLLAPWTCGLAILELTLQGTQAQRNGFRKRPKVLGPRAELGRDRTVTVARKLFHKDQVFDAPLHLLARPCSRDSASREQGH